ncbi:MULTISPECIES: hypothetical protein [unclassified Methylobacterium]|uniref:hypothetical protein n=1 Tax=unclassified Methylobacterium TaxID=2615210 RepID=UPI0006F751B8|nr:MULTISPECIES: hypothetical protein [unclassified Methylobacterium]KQP61575.1 hypothetical protein ASF39_02560 [Methylobacterium sp. Leaf108]KQT80777.1 hypothetical protein ASG59_04995 [Methylobacterium sp. Leaf466]
MTSHQHSIVEDAEGRALLDQDIQGHAAMSSTFIERREARSETNWIALIRLLDGTELPCNVKDISKSGARLGVPASCVLPDTFMLKVVGRNFVCLVKLAWRRGHYAGVRIERVGKLPEPARVEEANTQAGPDSGYKAIGTRRNSRVSSF